MEEGSGGLLVTSGFKLPLPLLAEMQNGWWWLRGPDELEAMVQVLHPRGIREKALHKHLIKHKEYLREVCARAANGKSYPCCGLEGGVEL